MMGNNAVSPYQQVIEKTKSLSFRSQMLAMNIEKKVAHSNRNEVNFPLYMFTEIRPVHPSAVFRKRLFIGTFFFLSCTELSFQTSQLLVLCIEATRLYVFSIHFTFTFKDTHVRRVRLLKGNGTNFTNCLGEYFCILFEKRVESLCGSRGSLM